MANKKGVGGKGAKASSPFGGELSRLRDLIQLMESHELAELQLEDQFGKVVLKKQGANSSGMSYLPQLQSAVGPVTSPAAAQAPTQNAPQNSAGGATSSKHRTIHSPFVGTFYRSASPDSDPYVKEGQSISKGQTLCIVEAMKLMNEIESDCTGKLISVLVDNGQPVEFGEPLFVIESV